MNISKKELNIKNKILSDLFNINYKNQWIAPKLYENIDYFRVCGKNSNFSYQESDVLLPRIKELIKEGANINLVIPKLMKMCNLKNNSILISIFKENLTNINSLSKTNTPFLQSTITLKNEPLILKILEENISIDLSLFVNTSVKNKQNLFEYMIEYKLHRSIIESINKNEKNCELITHVSINNLISKHLNNTENQNKRIKIILDSLIKNNPSFIKEFLNSNKNTDNPFFKYIFFHYENNLLNIQNNNTNKNIKKI